MCVYLHGCTAMVCMWKSEDNLWEVVLIRVLGTELRQSGLVASILTWPNSSLVQNNTFKIHSPCFFFFLLFKIYLFLFYVLECFACMYYVYICLAPSEPRILYWTPQSRVLSYFVGDRSHPRFTGRKPEPPLPLWTHSLFPVTAHASVLPRVSPLLPPHGDPLLLTVSVG